MKSEKGKEGGRREGGREGREEGVQERREGESRREGKEGVDGRNIAYKKEDIHIQIEG